MLKPNPNKDIGYYTLYMHYVKNTEKRYIGLTGQNPKRRWQNGSAYKENKDFSKDIALYGWSNIEHIVLAQIYDFELASQCERTAIELYKTTNPEFGYNMWEGGYDAKPIAKVGRNISKSKLGHEVTEETRNKLSQYGNKSVLCLDQQDNVIKQYPSLTDAANDVGAYKSNIWAVCNGKKSSCKGYKWTYAA